MSQRSLEVRPLSSALGAEILGADLARLEDSEFEQIRNAFFERSVIFFRDQKLTPEQHVEFAERWGEINVNRFFTPVEGHPRIAEVRKEPDQQINIGGGWHTDHSYDQIPAMGSILYAREIPPVGGDTLYAGMCAAYEALSGGLKRTLQSLRAVHSSRHVFGGAASKVPELADRIGNAEAANQDAVHPVALPHPETGRLALYVNPGFTIRFDGWSREESKPLLDFLYRHAQRPEFTLRFRWQPGSMAIWDNRSTWHYALNDYHGQRRLLHRITIEGVPLAS